MMGWTSTDVSQFHDLAVLGEQLLLTIRDGGWSDDADQETARSWARFWRLDILGYVRAYRAVTGVSAGRPTRQCPGSSCGGAASSPRTTDDTGPARLRPFTLVGRVARSCVVTVGSRCGRG
jgi:hypothetical protein